MIDPVARQLKEEAAPIIAGGAFTQDNLAPPALACSSALRYIESIEFEYDEAKSQANKAKHGIDFIEAKALWLDPDYVEAPVPHQGEPRFQVVGQIRGKHWTAFLTYRSDRIRMISVRRARKKEIRKYEEEHRD